MNVIQQLEKEQQKEKVPALRAGDTVKVHAKVVEGTRERIQVFEGTVIRVTGGGLRQNFTVRRRNRVWLRPIWRKSSRGRSGTTKPWQESAGAPR